MNRQNLCWDEHGLLDRDFGGWGTSENSDFGIHHPSTRSGSRCICTWLIRLWKMAPLRICRVFWTKKGGRFVVQLTKLARLAVNHHGGWLQFLFPCFVWVKYIECGLRFILLMYDVQLWNPMDLPTQPQGSPLFRLNILGKSIDTKSRWSWHYLRLRRGNRMARWYPRLNTSHCVSIEYQRLPHWSHSPWSRYFCIFIIEIQI